MIRQTNYLAFLHLNQVKATSVKLPYNCRAGLTVFLVLHWFDLGPKYYVKLFRTMRLKKVSVPIIRGRIKKEINDEITHITEGWPKWFTELRVWTDIWYLSDIWLCDWLLHTRLENWEKCTIRVNSEMITFSLFRSFFNPPAAFDMYLNRSNALFYLFSHWFS